MLLMIFFGSGISQHKLKRLERLVFVCLIIILFLLCESYLAIMLSYMLNTKYQAHLQTLDELEQSTLSICLKPGEKPALFQLLFREIAPNLANRISAPNSPKRWYDIEYCTWMMRYETAEIFLASSSNLEKETLHRKMYILPQKLNWMTRLHSVSRLRPFGEHFDRFLGRLFEGGFVKYWNDAIMGIILRRQSGSAAATHSCVWSQLRSLESGVGAKITRFRRLSGFVGDSNDMRTNVVFSGIEVRWKQQQQLLIDDALKLF
ncbi:hypothetical protein pipiens_010650 [Culex pipiens pipiens]|uniref:Uncharacterized protein n=1 Tax=Culex pipiens pipiens TaxID=38569 RepID=A0ABD1D9D1_CULPP